MVCVCVVFMCGVCGVYTCGVYICVGWTCVVCTCVVYICMGCVVWCTSVCGVCICAVYYTNHDVCVWGVSMFRVMYVCVCERLGWGKRWWTQTWGVSRVQGQGPEFGNTPVTAGDGPRPPERVTPVPTRGGPTPPETVEVGGDSPTSGTSQRNPGTTGLGYGPDWESSGSIRPESTQRRTRRPSVFFRPLEPRCEAWVQVDGRGEPPVGPAPTLMGPTCRGDGAPGRRVGGTVGRWGRTRRCPSTTSHLKSCLPLFLEVPVYPTPGGTVP